MLRFRAKGISRPWIDLRFGEFVADPTGEIERVYDAAGLALSAEARERMARWVEKHPRNDLVRALAADLAPYGIDPAEARERFAPYVETFGLHFDGI